MLTSLLLTVTINNQMESKALTLVKSRMFKRALAKKDIYGEIFQVLALLLLLPFFYSFARLY